MHAVYVAQNAVGSTPNWEQNYQELKLMHMDVCARMHTDYVHTYVQAPRGIGTSTVTGRGTNALRKGYGDQA